MGSAGAKTGDHETNCARQKKPVKRNTLTKNGLCDSAALKTNEGQLPEKTNVT